MQLVFGCESIQVDASLAERRGGLRAIAREAETRWGLVPGKFSFTASRGKVESAAALQLELEAAGNRPCRIEVCEDSDGKVLREMHKTVKACEDRMVARLETSIADVRRDLERIDSRVSNALAPMVQSLALEQMELREMPNALASMVDDLSREQTELRHISAGLAPMVQCLALEQMELRNKVTYLCDSDMSQSAAVTKVEDAMKSLEDVDMEMQNDCALQAASDIQEAALEDVERLSQDVSSLESVAKCSQQVPQPVSAMSLDIPQKECEQKKQRTQGLERGSHADSATERPMPPAFGYSCSKKAMDFLAPSAKWSHKETWGNFQTADLAAFPQYPITSHLSSSQRASWGSRSMPLLPPL